MSLFIIMVLYIIYVIYICVAVEFSLSEFYSWEIVDVYDYIPLNMEIEFRVLSL